jgi:hypothetical protein
MTILRRVGLRTQTLLGPRPTASWVGGPWECRSPIRTVFINKAVKEIGTDPGGQI